MRNRFLLGLASLALVVTACGQDTGLSGDGVTLRYAFQPGETLEYNTDLEMTMDMTTEGDFGLPGGLDMTLDMDLAARSTYDIEEGPDPETVRLTVSTDIVDGSASMEMLGMTEAIPLDDTQASCWAPNSRRGRSRSAAPGRPK